MSHSPSHLTNSEPNSGSATTVTFLPSSYSSSHSSSGPPSTSHPTAPSPLPVMLTSRAYSGAATAMDGSAKTTVTNTVAKTPRFKVGREPNPINDLSFKSTSKLSRNKTNYRLRTGSLSPTEEPTTPGAITFTFNTPARLSCRRALTLSLTKSDSVVPAARLYETRPTTIFFAPLPCPSLAMSLRTPLQGPPLHESLKATLPNLTVGETKIRRKPGADAICVKIAVTLRASFISSLQTLLPSQPPPDQPVNVDRLLGAALRTTLVAMLNLTEASNSAVQVAPQSIPTGLLFTVPPPVPALTTVKVRLPTAIKTAAILRDLLTVTVQVEELAQAETDQ